MKKILMILAFFILLVFCTNSCRGNDNQQNSSGKKSVAELLMEQAEIEVKALDDSKRTLNDLSEIEIEEMLQNPKPEDRELLIEYISKLDLDSFFFDPLVNGETLGHEIIHHQFFQFPDGDIDTNEIKIFKVSVDGNKEEIKHFFRSGAILAKPQETPGLFFFYIKDEKDTYNNFLWKIDGKKGIGHIITEKWGFQTVSQNGEYLIRRSSVDHTFGNDKYQFPVVEFFSIKENAVIKVFDFYPELKDEINIYDLEEGVSFITYRDSADIIAELKVMGDVIASFKIDTATFTTDRIK